MSFNLIVAFCKKNNGIGMKNTMPWHLKSELKYFKEITSQKNENQITNNILLMGRNTWDSLPKKPLPNRTTIIFSRTMDTSTKEKIESEYKDTYVRSDLESYINELNCFIEEIEDVNIFVIGGSQIYEQVMSLDIKLNIYATEIYKEYECDTFFPSISNERFALTNVSEFKEENGVYYRHKIYKNKDKISENEKWVNKEEMQYLNTLKEIMDEGQENIDRTNVGTRSIFGQQYKYNLRDTFPALTTKRIFFRGIFEEFMLYLTGKTNNNILNEKKIHIWDGNTRREFLDNRGLSHYPEGDMGETYGFNFRHFGGQYQDCKTNYESTNGYDQLQNVINLLKNDPTSRRIIINLWNASTLHNAALPSCLMMYQFYVDVYAKKLSCIIYIRSSDYFLANNWNTCTGALLVHLLCNLKEIDLTPGEIIINTGDTHIYKNHLEQVNINLERKPYPFCKLLIKNKKNKITDFNFEDLQFIGYKCYPNISAPMAV